MNIYKVLKLSPIFQEPSCLIDVIQSMIFSPGQLIHSI